MSRGHARLPRKTVTAKKMPGLATPLVYDASQLYLVVSRDFQVVFSKDYAPAFKSDSVAMKVTGRFGIGAPALGRSIRKLTVT